MKRHKNLCKCISLALVISLLFTFLTPLSSFAEEEAIPSKSDEEKWEPDLSDTLKKHEGDLSLEELATKELPEEDKPEVISDEVISEKGHVNRLWAQENDLNSIIFQNKDGKKTMYYFADPVKYVDKDGKIKDKKNVLSDIIDKQEYTEDYGYTNSANDVNTYFPKKLTKNKGVLLEYGKTKVELFPLYSKVKSVKENEIFPDKSTITKENSEVVNDSSKTKEESEVKDEQPDNSDIVKEVSEESSNSADEDTTASSDIKTESSDIDISSDTSDETEIKSEIDSEKTRKKAAVDSVSQKKQLKTGDGKEYDTVEYDKVFGEDTYLRYTPTFGGFKEDIVLNKNIGVNEFSFKVKTNGLSLVSEEGLYYLANPLTGEMVVKIGELLVTDSKVKETPFSGENTVSVKPKKPEKPEDVQPAADVEIPPAYNHYYIVETVAQDEEYIITVVVDEAFLNDKNTVYPVIIDPTLDADDGIAGYNVQDATIYSNYQVNQGYNSSIFVGNYNARYGGSRGTARTLVKFPGLINNQTFRSLSNDRINSVKYIPRDLMCEGDAVWIDCYRATQSWTESGVKCNSSIWNAYTGFLDDAYVQYNGGTTSSGTGTGHWYPIDITAAAKDWKCGYYGGLNNHYGIMLKAWIESDAAKTLASSDNSSYGPNVIVEYDTPIPVSYVSMTPLCKEVNVNWSGYVTATVYPTNAWNKTIYWTSSNSNVASVNYYSGLICASSAGTTVITATTADGGYTASCTLTVNQILTGSDVYINDQATRDAIIRCKNMYDYTQNDYYAGNITYSKKVEIQSSLNNAADIARADFIVVNPQSTYAYQKLGGSSTPIPNPLSRDITKNNTGFDVTVIQRVLELYTYFEPDDNYQYGTYDDITETAVMEYKQTYLIGNGNIIDDTTFLTMFSSNNAAQRTYEFVRMLNQFRIVHNAVALKTSQKVGGRTTSTTIYGAGIIGPCGYADIMRTGPTYEYIWEVKPDNNRYFLLQSSIGAVQLNRYITAWNANAQNIQPKLTAVPGFTVNNYAFEFGDEVVVVRSHPPGVYTPGVGGDTRGGLILYKKVSHEEYENAYQASYAMETEPVPVPVPSYSYGYSNGIGFNTSMGNGQITGVAQIGLTICFVVVIAGVVYFFPPAALALV